MPYVVDIRETIISHLLRRANDLRKFFQDSLRSTIAYIHMAKMIDFASWENLQSAGSSPNENTTAG